MQRLVTVAASQRFEAQRRGLQATLQILIRGLKISSTYYNVKSTKFNLHSIQQLIFCFRLKAVRYLQRFHILMTLIRCICRDTTVKATQQAPLWYDM
jgi:hypothetical protein